METKEETTLEENEENKETSTQVENADSEEAEDTLESLFADDDEHEDEYVSRKEYENLKKGAQKLATEFGNLKKAKKVEETKTKEEPKEVEKDDLSELFYTQVPNAELVEDDLQSVADAKYNGSILKAWKGEQWLQDKAQSMSEAKSKEEEAKSKIKKPSNGTAPQHKDLSSVKPEEVSELSPAEKSEWVRLQAEKERNSTD